MNATPSHASPHNAPPNFDSLARIYRPLEWLTFGPFLHRCRLAYLHQMRTARQALVLGDGDGRFSAALLQANPAIHIDAIDSSPAMLRQLLRRAAPYADRVHTRQIDARAWSPGSARYDLIVSHFFLDCFSTAEVAGLAEKIAQAAAPGALWVISDFQVSEGWHGRLIAQPIVAVLYRAFWLLTGLRTRRLPSHAQALAAPGFTLIWRTPLLAGLLVAEAWRVPAPSPKQLPWSHGVPSPAE